ncbi:PKD domain-containing protein [Haloferacaceae archaeon DSL9]
MLSETVRPFARAALTAILVCSMIAFLPTASASDDAYVVVQGDRCIATQPIGGDDDVEAFYDYRHRYIDDGNRDHERWGRYFSSEGTVDYQADDASILMLYEGPDGVSLVAVHDMLHEESEEGTTGGSASFFLSDLPDGEWAVLDDNYGYHWAEGDQDDIFYFAGDEPEAIPEFDGTPPDGVDAQLNWVWQTGRTDGMAYRVADDEFDLEIDPAFNEASYHRYGDERRDGEYDDPSAGERYNGTIDDWQVIVPTDDDFERVSLDSLDDPVRVASGTCADAADAAVDLAVDSGTVAAGETEVAFEATVDGDAGWIDAYRWDFDGDGDVDATTTEPTAAHVYDALGTYEPTVSAVFADNSTITASAAVSATAEVAIDGPETVSAGSTVTLAASSIEGADYEWALGDGTTATGERIEHAYDEPGTYVVRLLVERDGATVEEMAVVAVEADPADETPADEDAPDGAAADEGATDSAFGFGILLALGGLLVVAALFARRRR